MKYLQGLIILTYLLGANLYAAPKSEYWSLWDKAGESSLANIDHSRWQDFLNNYLTTNADGTVLVRYGEVSATDRKILDSYINDIASLDPKSYRRAVQKAYWINLYNALTVRLILDNYPLDSIRDLGGLFSFGPWDDELIEVNGTALTLNDIEHRILRPIWQDKRIHYAVNCASIGCPNLLQNAYTADSLETQLEEATKTFINQDKALAQIGNKLVLSSIYDWYAIDFGSFGELEQHLLNYLDPDKHSLLKKRQGKPEYRYDWLLNDAS